MGRRSHPLLQVEDIDFLDRSADLQRRGNRFAALDDQFVIQFLQGRIRELAHCFPGGRVAYAIAAEQGGDGAVCCCSLAAMLLKTRSPHRSYRVT